MDAFTVHTGRAVALRRSDIDTDQIIPSDWLKRVERTGFGAGLFSEWRQEPTFELNLPQHAGATVLVTGENFGIGSSREHAVWALQDFGFRAVVSSRFGDIFRSNALKGGLLPVQLPPGEVEQLMRLVEADASLVVTVDLTARELRAPGLLASFDLDDFTRWRLLEGLDDVGLTLQHTEQIQAFEQTRPEWMPVVGQTAKQAAG